MLNSGRSGLRGAGLRTPPAAPAPAHKAPLARPEPDYEVVEFPTEQYVNAKLQPPPPPPRPASDVPSVEPCGLCGGGGARVRCSECGRRALCASCDEMYHRHPKRRHHMRQTLIPNQTQQIHDVRPPLPPKNTPPVPPPRKHKASAEKLRPPCGSEMRRRATLSSLTPQPNNTTTLPHITRPLNPSPSVRFQQPPPAHLGSLPYLAGPQNPLATTRPVQATTLMHPSNWSRMRPTHPVPSMPSNMGWPAENWEMPEPSMPPNVWGGQLRRGASVLELGAGTMGSCSGCAHCYRYGSHTSLERPWHAPWPSTPCCSHPPHHHSHSTPQPYRRECRTMSRAGSRAASPALSVRSRASRRVKPRTPSPSLPSSDADSESECDPVPEKRSTVRKITKEEIEESSLGPPPPAPSGSWECEHCTFVNDSGIRVCVVCCKTPTTTPQIVNKLTEDVAKVTLGESSLKSYNGELTNQGKQQATINFGTSPPRDRNARKSSVQLNTNDSRSRTPQSTQNHIKHQAPANEYNNDSQTRSSHSISVGCSPPREFFKQNQVATVKHNASVGPSPPREVVRRTPTPNEVTKHNASVGTSPPRDVTQSRNTSVGSRKHSVSVGPSPPRDITPSHNTPARSPFRESNPKVTVKMTTSSTGTSPPPQSISTQTYEVSPTWERAPSANRSRSRRRFRDDARRERSHSRHSMSSDTRESERSVRTTGRWEWRENRDSSPGASDEERRRPTLTRRASHLDLRRTRPTRRTSLYGSAAVSPEPLITARSLEMLAGMGARREAERGLELARLLGDAESLGFNATEVHAALAQSPGAPLAWLRERWPSLCSGVRAAAARLAPGINVTETEARTALAKHRGALWPAVTECVERFRHQIDTVVGEEGRLRGHVWGSPAGAEVEAAPPSSRRSHRIRAAESSDEFEFEPSSPVKFQTDEYVYMPGAVDNNSIKNNSEYIGNSNNKGNISEDIAKKLKELLIQAGVPAIDESLLIKGLLNVGISSPPRDIPRNVDVTTDENRNNVLDLGQSENDFIEAYNQLTRLSPLPITKIQNNSTHNNSQELRPAVSTGEVTKKRTHDQTNILQKKPAIYKSPIDSDSSSSMTRRRATSKKNTKKETKATVESLKKVNNVDKTRSQPKGTSNMNLEKKVTTLEEDKTNNLNDIVDNTQKIIQQMKDEINSDINSLEGNDISASESDNSSDGPSVSSGESTYDESESDNESHDMASNENETSSAASEASQPKESSAVEKLLLNNRTSSEDNEQFEEAIDHLEGEVVVDEIKQSNMEKLDSIVRSLQEEHTVSVEINTPSERNVNNIQDLNNNFTTAQTFEEIYEELDRNNAFHPQTRNASVIDTQNIAIREAENLTNYKREVTMISYIPDNAQQISVQLNDYKVLNALLDYSNEYIEKLKNNEDDMLDKTDESSQVEDITIVPIDKLNILTNVSVERAPSSSSDSTSNTESDKTQIMNNSSENVAILDTIQQNEEKLKTQLVTTIQISDDPVTEIIQIETHEIHKNNGNIIINNSNDMKLPSKIANITNNQKTTMKSNIPKLVKSTNAGQSSLKTASKQPVSKVPVRRISVKQYPAPSPPKTHFGNIQSGHVKQLQTRLFNKSSDATSEPTKSETATSTLSKTKKQAPPPPPTNITNTRKLSTPPPTSPSRKQFFRETCGTEDEWTESDDDLPARSPARQDNETIAPSSSPPPPITLRRVSGQIIDLANVKLPEGSPERQARMILAEGAAETWEQAQLAVELVARGTEAPTALLAALECLDLPSALAYLHQECELCASRLPEHEMVSMLRCTHRCCRECACVYFTVQITERSIVDCVCPYCKAPELDALADDAELEYFAHLDILLKTLLKNDVHELFQRKLRDRTLARDPNFRWCVECSSGFFVHPKQKRLRCPECRSLTCATCRKQWIPQHEGLTCEEFTAWQEDNDPERSVAAVNQHLKENGLECPRCHFKYSLSRGGCMHFTCTQCKYEFCYGCGKPFMMGARCGLSEYCAKLGLHAHHPRNCLFYLRDKEPHELQTLLQMNNVAYETELAESSGTNRCPVQLQRETPTGLVDGACNAEVAKGHAGLCKVHYVEYLAKLSRGLDPIPIMDVMDLVAELRRRALPLPERGPWDTDPIYAGMCAEIVKEKIPLD